MIGILFFIFINIQYSTESVEIAIDNTVGNTFYVGGTGPGNYSKIQDAIDNAHDWDQIYVYSGFYQENLLIYKSILLNGEDITDTILEGNHSEPIITISNGKTTITGFTIMNLKNPGIGIYVLTDNTTISGNNIKNTNNGILIKNTLKTTVIDNLFFNNSFAVEMRQSSNNIIKKNTFIDNFGGIEDSSNGTNIIDKNIFINNSYCAIQLEFHISNDTIVNNIIKNNGHGITLNCHSTLIQNNTIQSNKNYGIRLKSKKSVDNTITENKIHGNLDGGISLENEASDNMIKENIISNNQRFGGINLLSTSNNIIINNEMINNGITIDGFFKNNWISHKIENNTANDKPIRYLINKRNIDISENTGQIILVNCRNCKIKQLNLSNVSRGIQIAYSSNIDINNNIITNNDYGGIFIESSTRNSIENNILHDNIYGIILQNTRTTKVISNAISQSELGIFINTYFSPVYCLLRGFFFNMIKENNLIDNKDHAYFVNSFLNIWYHNYWDNHEGTGRKIINGYWGDPLGAIIIDWYNFDWFPAKEPYDISTEKIRSLNKNELSYLA